MILNASEQMGGNLIDISISDYFHNTINACNLIDLGYIGDKFTWANNQADKTHIHERLDRFLATPSWTATYPNYKNNDLLRFASDHCPMILEFWTNNTCRNSKNNRHLLRFEQLWLQNDDSVPIVKSSWQLSTGDTTNRLKDTLQHLHNWGKNKYGDIPNFF